MAQHEEEKKGEKKDYVSPQVKFSLSVALVVCISNNLFWILDSGSYRLQSSITFICYSGRLDHKLSDEPGESLCICVSVMRIPVIIHYNNHSGAFTAPGPSF